MGQATEIDGLFRSPKAKTLENLKRLNIRNIEDLLWLLPTKYDLIPRLTPVPSPKDLLNNVGKSLTLEVKVVSIRTHPSKNRGFKGRPLQNAKGIFQDSNGPHLIAVQWFNIYPGQLKSLEKDKQILICGKITLFAGQAYINSPEILADKTLYKEDKLRPVYPKIEGVQKAQLTKLYKKIPESFWDGLNDIHLKSLPENWPSLPLAFKTLHLVGRSEISKKELELSRNRLIYEEFFDTQIKSYIRKKQDKKKTSLIILSPKSYEDFKLPFPLTLAQEKTLNSIFKDLSSGQLMSRLIQGDVGCGKTVIAFIAMIQTARHGHQAALMCPTETLARQHYQEFKKLFPNDENDCRLLVGSTKTKEKKRIKEDLLLGNIKFLIGTHALGQKDVEFKRPGLMIIDEQHKFGVQQRLSLGGFKHTPHTLLMTATPIPRTLGQTLYGHFDISIIDELPSNRKGIKTRIVHPDKFQLFLNFLKTRLEMGEQAYIVTPAIEENEEMQMANLEKVFIRFRKFFPDLKIDILHGKLGTDQKQIAYERFLNKETKLLISTSVIEVGINNPNATIMAITGPERFGLSSLHQLRGRIGRGNLPGFCFLVLDKRPSNASLERLKVIEKTTKGHIIANEDLKIRGPGDLFGNIQSGIGGMYRIANLVEDADILEMAVSDAQETLTPPYNLSIKRKLDQFSQVKTVHNPL